MFSNNPNTLDKPNIPQRLLRRQAFNFPDDETDRNYWFFGSAPKAFINIQSPLYQKILYYLVAACVYTRPFDLIRLRRTIANKLGCSVKTITRVTNQMVADGLLIKMRRYGVHYDDYGKKRFHGQSNLYRLHDNFFNRKIIKQCGLDKIFNCYDWLKLSSSKKAAYRARYWQNVPPLLNNATTKRGFSNNSMQKATLQEHTAVNLEANGSLFLKKGKR